MERPVLGDLPPNDDGDIVVGTVVERMNDAVNDVFNDVGSFKPKILLFVICV